jgi:hypothetical protein
MKVPENGTLGGQGCGVAAAAMVSKFYGIDTDPQPRRRRKLA